MNPKGYVYILTNPAMPGLVKIGMTTRSVEQRADELFTSGVPVPFEVYSEFYSPDCAELEQTLHVLLSKFRENSSREFFRIDPVDAERFIKGQLEEQVREIVSEFMPDHSIVHQMLEVSEADIGILAETAGRNSVVVATALGDITLDEIAPALARYDARVEATKLERMQ